MKINENLPWRGGFFFDNVDRNDDSVYTVYETNITVYTLRNRSGAGENYHFKYIGSPHL